MTQKNVTAFDPPLANAAEFNFLCSFYKKQTEAPRICHYRYNKPHIIQKQKRE